ncbi:MAG: hypothetical protein Q8L48_02965 [Archangium sp.]|nr:hypothetical protein [Archangium sp.]
MDTAHSYWLKTDDVSVASLRQCLNPVESLGASIECYRRPGVTLLVLREVNEVGEGEDALAEAQRALGQLVGDTFFHLRQETGAVSASYATAFDSQGEELWFEGPPDDPRSARQMVAGYWKIHRALKLKAGDASVELWGYPALEPSGWKHLVWNPGDARARKEFEQDQQRAKLVATDEALASLARKCRGQQPLALLAEHDKVRVSTEAGRRNAMKRLGAGSLLLRKSKVARALACRYHSSAFKFSVGLLLDHDTLAALADDKRVERHFGKRVTFLGNKRYDDEGLKQSLGDLTLRDHVTVLLTEAARCGVLFGAEPWFDVSDRRLVPEVVKRLSEASAAKRASVLHALGQRSSAPLGRHRPYVLALQRFFAGSPTVAAARALEVVGFPKPQVDREDIGNDDARPLNAESYLPGMVGVAKRKRISSVPLFPKRSRVRAR